MQVLFPAAGGQIVHINEGKDKLALVLFAAAVIALVPVH